MKINNKKIKYIFYTNVFIINAYRLDKFGIIIIIRS